MKKLLILLPLLLILPSTLFAEKSYFLVCKDIEISDVIIKKDISQFKRGTLFDASAAFCAYRTNGNFGEVEKRWYDKTPDELMNMAKSRHRPSKMELGEPAQLKVYYGTHGFKMFGWVDLSSGCWFKSEKDITKIINKGFFNGYFKGYDGDELFKKPLDKKLVDIMCSPHSTQFSVDGNMFTDITMEKREEYVKFAERTRIVYSAEIGHLFWSKSAGCSDSNRPRCRSGATLVFFSSFS